MNLKLRYRTRQPQVLQRIREVSLAECDLQILLDRIGATEFNVNPTARDLIDYLDGKGEFATYVDIAVRHKDVRHLLDQLSQEAHFTLAESPVIEHCIVEEGDEVGFCAEDARTTC